jgi:hypothetical protein
MAGSVEEAQPRLRAALQQLGMELTSEPGRLKASATRSWRDNRWAAKVEIELRPSIDDTTAAICTVEMAGDKHYSLVDQILEAVEPTAIDDRGVAAAIAALGAVSEAPARKQIRHLRRFLHADERVLALGLGIYLSKPGLVVLTDRRLFLFAVSLGSQAFEEFAVPSIRSLQVIRSPGGEKLVVDAIGGSSEITQMFLGHADVIERALHDLPHAGAPSNAAAHGQRRPTSTETERRSREHAGRRQPRPDSSRDASSDLPRDDQGLASPPASSSRRDLFISHASEDNELVARPLADALRSRGWTVWLDELELTIGDSLNGRINDALAKSRFGVVVLSRAFFAKQWPQRELAGLAAREVSAGSKVILPVWHEVDQRFIVERAPILADRLGASTALGIAAVADDIGRALRRADLTTTDDPEPLLMGMSNMSDPGWIAVPRTSAERAALIAERSDYWEYRLFAAVLRDGRRDLEPKWRDHQLRLGRGPRAWIDADSALQQLGREIGWVGDQGAAVMRMLDPVALVAVFGAPGEPGDAALIEHLARRIVKAYEDMLDWAASLRSTSVPEPFEELRDVTAEHVDRPIDGMRQFMDDVVDQMTRLPQYFAIASVEHPPEIRMTLTLEADPAVSAKLDQVLARLRRRLR